MTDHKPVNPTELDSAQAARKIEEAGIADESAAYVNGGDADEAAGSTDTQAEAEAKAHPS